MCSSIARILSVLFVVIGTAWLFPNLAHGQAEAGWFDELPYRAQVLLKVVAFLVGVLALGAIWYYLLYFCLLKRARWSPDTSFHVAWVVWVITSILAARLIFWDFLTTGFWIFWVLNVVVAGVCAFSIPRTSDI